MNATAVVPVKRFGAAKQRLGDSLSTAERRELAESMLHDVLAALARCKRLDGVIVVSGEAAAREAAEAAGAGWIDDPLDAGHSEAAGLGVAATLDAGAECAALLPGDCPLLDPAELDRVLGEMRTGVAGVIPDRHGSGTNGLLLAPPDAIAPAFGPGSRERHLELARHSSTEPRLVEVPSLALDLDTPEDLKELTRLLAEDPELAPATADVLAGKERW